MRRHVAQLPHRARQRAGHCALSRRHFHCFGLGQPAPSLLVQDALERLAGTDAARANAFADQALGFIVTLRDLVRQHLREGKKAASVREYAEAVPQFTFKEAAAGERFRPVVIDFAILCGFGALAWLGVRPKS